ncbi:DUF3022 domain-containing protein [Paraburkholderia sp. BCC1886]|uniref:DUF3022 domain-containing protein n=1 Tax=Paraburkholderia sp. BCC1886 TaxID=2562670 RepID=UPI001182F07C|nr:DUF3022 domain-containing protein [Paraburkholderia sp. BCC1886]
MHEINREQRVEEIEVALAGIFDSPKAPAISSYDDGKTLFVQTSWVIKSQGDTTLDSRYTLTITLSEAQFERYAQMDTAQRIIVRERLCKLVRERLQDRDRQGPPGDESSAELAFEDRLLDIDEPSAPAFG